MEGVGSELCNQMKIILEKYNLKQLQELIEDIKEGIDKFSTDELINVIEGTTKVEYDDCDDIEYTYVIDYINEFVGVNFSDDYFVTLPFEMIKKGYKFTDIIRSDIRSDI